MKRLLLVLAAALIWAILSPAPVSAGWWPRSHHSKAKAEANAGHKEHTRRAWFHHRQKQQHNSSDPLYTSGPKTVGWWHKGPGPAGAGS